MQHVFDDQKENFDHVNELENLNFEHHSQDFKYLPGQKTAGGGGVSLQEGASIGINTVFPKRSYIQA